MFIFPWTWPLTAEFLSLFLVKPVWEWGDNADKGKTDIMRERKQA